MFSSDQQVNLTFLLFLLYVDFFFAHPLMD